MRLHTGSHGTKQGGLGRAVEKKRSHRIAFYRWIILPKRKYWETERIKPKIRIW